MFRHLHYIHKDVLQIGPAAAHPIKEVIQNGEA